jgi:hypothetical protein
MQTSSRPSSGSMSGPQRNGGWPRMPLLAITISEARRRSMLRRQARVI